MDPCKIYLYKTLDLVSSPIWGSFDYHYFQTLVTPGTISSSITNNSSVHFFATSALVLLFSATLYFFLINAVSTN